MLPDPSLKALGQTEQNLLRKQGKQRLRWGKTGVWYKPEQEGDAY